MPNYHSPTYITYKCGDWNLLETSDAYSCVWNSDVGIWQDVTSLKQIERMARRMLARSEPWP